MKQMNRDNILWKKNDKSIEFPVQALQYSKYKISEK